ncbi:MAG: hypothetical protein PF637_03960 [Spirochaetes bacterium]|jgi:hypothetical protein|nr:hypothetical protein [Spirochaetota bacterium]
MESADIRTTIDINVKWLEVIEDYAAKENMTISDVMNIVLDEHMKKLANNPKRNIHAMKYQQRGTEYESRHIRLTHITYSRVRDIMNLFRYTLSYLLSLAMEYFEEYTGNGKKVFFRPGIHSVIVNYFDDPKYFSNYWGLPPAEHLQGG